MSQVIHLHDQFLRSRLALAWARGIKTKLRQKQRNYASDTMNDGKEDRSNDDESDGDTVKKSQIMKKHRLPSQYNLTRKRQRRHRFSSRLPSGDDPDGSSRGSNYTSSGDYRRRSLLATSRDSRSTSFSSIASSVADKHHMVTGNEDPQCSVGGSIENTKNRPLSLMLDFSIDSSNQLYALSTLFSRKYEILASKMA